MWLVSSSKLPRGPKTAALHPCPASPVSSRMCLLLKTLPRPPTPRDSTDTRFPRPRPPPMVGERDHHGGCPGQASFIASLTHVKQEGREPKKSLRTVRAVSSQRKTFSSPHPDRALDQKDVREFALICIKISPVPLENLERELALGPWLPGPGSRTARPGWGALLPAVTVRCLQTGSR